MKKIILSLSLALPTITKTVLITFINKHSLLDIYLVDTNNNDTYGAFESTYGETSIYEISTDTNLELQCFPSGSTTRAASFKVDHRQEKVEYTIAKATR